MSAGRGRVEFTDTAPGPRPPRRSGGIKDYLSGNALSREGVTGQLPYLLFLAFLAVMYITNRYRYEHMVRQGQALHREVSNLRSKSITTAAELMLISRQSQVARMVREKGLGLEESREPPRKIGGRP